MKMSMLFSVLLCSVMIGYASTTSPTNMTCDFLRNGDSIRVVVANNSKQDIKIYNHFKERHGGAPAFVAVKIVDDTGKVLTQNAISKDGYWTSRFLDSTFRSPPYKMKKLKSGKSIIETVELPIICWGLDRNSGKELRIQETDLVKLKVIIFLDSSLKTWMTFESDYLKDDKKTSRTIGKAGVAERP